MNKKLHIYFLFLLVCFSSISALGQMEIDSIHLQKTYIINNHESIYLPLGNMSFADSVVSYTPGIPAPLPSYIHPERALGEPDFNHYKDESFVSLGCNGQLTLQFVSNGFIDIEGDDLYFFEVGPSVESFKVEISTDGEDWIYIGTLPGSNCSIDIGRSQRVRTEQTVYYFVRITDLGDFCRGPTPGADIDAVGAIGGVLKFNLSASVLFDSDEYELKFEAKETLNKITNILKLMPYAFVQIDGHTDWDASKTYNEILGENRALSVRNYLDKTVNGNENPLYIGMEVRSFGKTKPISSNITEEGKQKNRRVEIMVLPPDTFFEKP
ncbi:MAG TPA: OmpA family protein [Flavobacteriaceae bacterium]|nr:OmpA family protein [Flavobacteriaceae bacterium]